MDDCIAPYVECQYIFEQQVRFFFIFTTKDVGFRDLFVQMRRSLVFLSLQWN